MIITLNDGDHSYGYNVKKREGAGLISLRRHCLRYHIYDKETELAVKKFSTTDRSLQDNILAAAARVSGIIDNSNTWIRPVIKRRELWPLGNEAQMVLRDLRAYWGDDVSLRGTSKRYIYYLSDGSIENTPDALGMKFGVPLIYEGYAMATIFDIRNLDPLSSDKNVVYWLTKPMWESFHTARRRVVKEFPWPTGFVATKWCQRDGYSRYRRGISLASMTQGQTVGSWSVTSLPRFWIEHLSNNIFEWKAKTFDIQKELPQTLKSVTKQINHYALVQEGCKFGLALITCPNCGKYISNVWRSCHACNLSFSVAATIKEGLTYCTACGKRDKLCPCNEGSSLVTLTTDQVASQMICINSKLKQA